MRVRRKGLEIWICGCEEQCSEDGAEAGSEEGEKRLKVIELDNNKLKDVSLRRRNTQKLWQSLWEV